MIAYPFTFNSENDDTDDGPLTLALCSLCFLSDLQTLFASKSSAHFPVKSVPMTLVAC